MVTTRVEVVAATTLVFSSCRRRMEVVPQIPLRNLFHLPLGAEVDSAERAMSFHIVETQVHNALVLDGQRELELLLAVLDGHRLLGIGFFAPIPCGLGEVVPKLRLLAGVESHAALHDNGVALFEPG